MVLFPAPVLEDLRRLPGASYSFARQLASPEGEGLRGRLEAIAEGVAPAVSDRWAEMLASFDNRRFFQGLAEAGVCAMLGRAGWSVLDLAWPGPGLDLRAPNDQRFHGMILGFIRQVRPGADARTLTRLRQALDRIPGRSRIGLVINRWLPHDFDPGPVRHAVELWLREVERGAWAGRFAAYEDENISLEFTLTGETAARGEPLVAFAIGPFQAQRTLEAVGTRIVRELDRLRLLGHSDEPVLVACVADQPWRVSPGFLRDLLYGRPVWQRVEGQPQRMWSAYDAGDAPSLYRDSLYRCVSGTLFLERAGPASADLRGSASLNPWANTPLDPALLPVPSFAPTGSEGPLVVMAR